MKIGIRLTCILLLASSAGLAQDQVQCDLSNLVIGELTREVAQPPQTTESAISAAVAEAPEAAPSTTQATAPTAADAGSTVDSPERPSWVALAIEQGVASENDNGGITISLSPFDWLERSHPDGFFADNGNYVATKGLRRLTGSLSLGNQGEALDADGDGMPEDPASAKSLEDSVLVELQYQFYGSRDRREVGVGNYYRKELGRLQELAVSVTTDFDQIFGHERVVDAETRLSAAVESGALRCEAAAAALLAEIRLNDEWKTTTARLGEASFAIDKLREELVRKIDGSWVWSAGLSALDREDYLGRDQLKLSLRGLKGVVDPASPVDNSTFVFNLDYARIESLTASEKDLRSGKLGIEYVSPFRMVKNKAFDQARWAVSVSGEKTWDAPATAKKSELVVGWRMEIPVAKSISVPLSIKWSNRNELLQDEDEIVGHVGLSIDFETLFRGGGK